MTTKPNIKHKTKKTADKPRKLTKKEEEEYQRLMNEAWQPIAKSIREGKIRLPWFRESQ
ncbi:MAG: hypothetical protein KY445_04210 [Armatimonadetes bacterium]|nr:hypothetical protein [Armatimonadota bacterium]